MRIERRHQDRETLLLRDQGAIRLFGELDR